MIHYILATNFVFISGWHVVILMFKQNHIFLNINWQKGSIDLKLIQNDLLNDWKHIRKEHQIKLHFMGVSLKTQWLFCKSWLLQPKSCNYWWNHFWSDNMMSCKNLSMLLLYFFSYIESKIGNATFLKLRQVIPVPAIHMGFV